MDFSVLLEAPADAPEGWHPIAKLGDYQDRRYGRFSITADDYAAWQAALAEHQNGEVPIDYDHQAGKGNTKAAGWLRALKLEDGKVMGKIAWTPQGAQDVRDGYYRYVSPEFTEKYRDESGRVVGKALVGVALTNRPFLRKGMPALALSRDGEAAWAVGPGDQPPSDSTGEGEPIPEPTGDESARALAFAERLHPRDSHGRWVDAPGSGSRSIGEAMARVRPGHAVEDMGDIRAGKRPDPNARPTPSLEGGTFIGKEHAAMAARVAPGQLDSLRDEGDIVDVPGGRVEQGATNERGATRYRVYADNPSLGSTRPDKSPPARKPPPTSGKPPPARKATADDEGYTWGARDAHGNLIRLGDRVVTPRGTTGTVRSRDAHGNAIIETDAGALHTYAGAELTRHKSISGTPPGPRPARIGVSRGAHAGAGHDATTRRVRDSLAYTYRRPAKGHPGGGTGSRGGGSRERIALAARPELAATIALNWVEQRGGLPPYIKRISKHLEAAGMSRGHAIAVAVNAARRMCASGDLNFKGKQAVNAGSRAEACAAVARWDAMKASAGGTVAASLGALEVAQLARPFDEGKVRRDPRGRFARKAGGAIGDLLHHAPKPAPAAEKPPGKRARRPRRRRPYSSQAVRETMAQAADGSGAITVSDRGFTDGTMAAFSPDGGRTWTARRTRLRPRGTRPIHDGIVAAALDGAATFRGERPEPHEPPHATFAAGGPASGKSTLLELLDAQGARPPHVLVNPDTVKAGLPEYREAVRDGDEAAAGVAHEESSTVAKRISAEATERRLDQLVDGVGDSPPGKFAGKIRALLDQGYAADVVYATVSVPEAVRREKKRAKGGRKVNGEFLEQAHRDVTDRFTGDVSELRDADVKVYDTTEKGKIHMIARVPPGRAGLDEVEVYDPEAYAAFLAKGTQA